MRDYHYNAYTPIILNVPRTQPKTQVIPKDSPMVVSGRPLCIGKTDCVCHMFRSGHPSHIHPELYFGLTLNISLHSTFEKEGIYI